jgi:hypothetical protein
LLPPASTLLPSPARAEGDDAISGYAILVRDILIVRQCGLSDELVEAGFRLEVETLAASQALTPEAAAAARERGQEVYRMAWRDRGSGPVDPAAGMKGRQRQRAFAPISWRIDRKRDPGTSLRLRLTTFFPMFQPFPRQQPPCSIRSSYATSRSSPISTTVNPPWPTG